MGSHRILQSLSSGDLTIRAAEYAEGGLTPAHSHENARMVLVLRGQFEEYFGQKKQECSGASLIFRPAGESHRERFLSRRNLCISMDIGRGWLRNICDEPLPQEPFCFQSPHLLPISAQLARELQARDRLSEAVFESLLTELLGMVLRTHSILERKFPLWLRILAEFLRSGPNRFTIRQLAAQVGVHPVHLARVFRRYYGCTIGEYLRAIRIQQAQQDLLDSKEPLVDIAIRYGFADQSHFTRIFKRVTGVTPARYRLQRF